MIRFDTGELSALAVDLGKTGIRLTGQLERVFSDGADDLVDLWRRNVEESSGPYSGPYREAIDVSRLVSSEIVFEVGPNPSMPQGKMAFEFGDHNHPPHLDGQRAADELIPKIGRRVEIALGDLGL